MFIHIKESPVDATIDHLLETEISNNNHSLSREIQHYPGNSHTGRGIRLTTVFTTTHQDQTLEVKTEQTYNTENISEIVECRNNTVPGEVFVTFRVNPPAGHKLMFLYNNGFEHGLLMIGLCVRKIDTPRCLNAGSIHPRYHSSTQELAQIAVQQELRSFFRDLQPYVLMQQRVREHPIIIESSFYSGNCISLGNTDDTEQLFREIIQ